MHVPVRADWRALVIQLHIEMHAIRAFYFQLCLFNHADNSVSTAAGKDGTLRKALLPRLKIKTLW